VNMDWVLLSKAAKPVEFRTIGW